MLGWWTSYNLGVDICAEDSFASNNDNYICWDHFADTSLEFWFSHPKVVFLLNIVLRASRVDIICAKNNWDQNQASGDPGEGQFWAENNSDRFCGAFPSFCGRWGVGCVKLAASMDPSSSWGCGRCWQGGAHVSLGLSWRPSDQTGDRTNSSQGLLPRLFSLVRLTWDVQWPVWSLACAELLPRRSFEVDLQVEPAKSSLWNQCTVRPGQLYPITNSWSASSDPCTLPPPRKSPGSVSVIRLHCWIESSSDHQMDLLRCEAGMRKTPWVDLFFSGSELNEPVKEAKEEVLKGVCIQQQQLGGWWWWGCSWECWEKCVGRECWCWWRQVKKCWWLLLRWSVMARGQRPHPSNKYTFVAKHQIHFCLPNSKYTFEFCLLGLVTSQYTNYSVIAIWAFVSIISMSQPRWQTYSNVQQKNCKNLHLLLPIREKLYLRT